MSDPNFIPPNIPSTALLPLTTIEGFLQAGRSVLAARALLESPFVGQPSPALRLGALGHWAEALRLLERIAGVTSHNLERLADNLLPPEWIGDEELRFELLYTLSLAYTRTAEYDCANDVIETAQILAAALNNSAAEGRALGRMANNWMLMGELQQATNLYERAITIARQTQDKVREGSWLGDAGIPYAILGQTHRATAYFTEAADIARQTGDLLEEARRRGNVGWALLDCGSFAAARDHIQYALDYATAHNDQLSALQQRLNYGRLHLYQKEPHAAFGYLTTALVSAQASASVIGQAEAWTLLSDAYIAIGDISDAIDAVYNALDFARLSESPDLLTAAYNAQGALSLAQHNLNAAHEAFEQAGFLSADMNALYLNGRALCGTGDVAQARNDIPGAFRAWFAAWSVYNQTECGHSSDLKERLVALYRAQHTANIAVLLQTIPDPALRAAFQHYCQPDLI